MAAGRIDFGRIVEGMKMCGLGDSTIFEALDTIYDKLNRNPRRTSSAGTGTEARSTTDVETQQAPPLLGDLDETVEIRLSRGDLVDLRVHTRNKTTASRNVLDMTIRPVEPRRLLPNWRIGLVCRPNTRAAVVKAIRGLRVLGIAGYVNDLASADVVLWDCEPDGSEDLGWLGLRGVALTFVDEQGNLLERWDLQRVVLRAIRDLRAFLDEHRG